MLSAMKTVELSTHLDAPIERVWRELNKPRLLLFVSHPMIDFRIVSPSHLPEQWEEGDYVFQLKWQGVVPIGKQTICFSKPDGSGDELRVRDNGHSALIKRWDHVITLKPQNGGTRYTDRVEIEAGLLTPFIAVFAKRFYAHRQNRWRALVANDFDYDSG